MSAAPSYVHRERVRFGDLDAMRHLNNVVFLRYFETARIAFMSELVPGHDPTKPEGDDTAMIFAECHIAYRSPVHFGEEVDVHLSIGEVRRSAFRIDFAMRVGERLAAEGHGWLVAFDYVTQKAARLTPELVATLSGDQPG